MIFTTRYNKWFMHNYVIEMEEIIKSPERQVRGKILFVHFQFVSFFFHVWKNIQYVAYTPLKLVCKQYICKKRWKKFCRVIFNVFLSFVNVVPILCVRKLEKRTVTSSVFEKKKKIGRILFLTCFSEFP